MPTISPEFIERYQIEYQKNPNSRIFAPLAEAYRQMGLHDEAYMICAKGVQFHPEFAGGRVAFARILLDRGDQEKALVELEKAVLISPDNLLAYTLLGDTLLELRRPKDALKAFKMVLFLNPNDDRAQAAVRKWEFLSADEYDEDLFKVKPVFVPEPAPVLEPKAIANPKNANIPRETPADRSWIRRQVERAVSLADAFTVRSDLEKAIEVLKAARQELGASEEIERRLSLLEKRTRSLEDFESSQVVEPPPDERELRRQKLETFLQRISERRY